MEKLDIVFIWVEDLHGVLVEENINFGSELFFSINKKGKKLDLEIIENKKYVGDFFSVENFNCISNVSVFVGKNGSGKSILCKLIKDIVVGNFPDSNFILITRKRNNKDSKPEFSVYNQSSFNLDSSGIKKTSFKFSFINKIEPKEINGILFGAFWQKLSGVEAIYYTPIVDWSNIDFYSSNRKGIDISTNNLFLQNLDHEEFARRSGLEPGEILKTTRGEEFRRHFKMIHEFREFEFPSGTIKLHSEGIQIRIKDFKTNLENIYDSSEGHNVPLNFKKLITELEKKYRNEQRSLFKEKNLADDKKDNIGSELVQKRLLINHFAYSALKFFIYNLDKSNNHLFKGLIKTEYDISSLGFIEAVFEFFNNQDIFAPSSLLGSIELLSNNISTLKLIDRYENEEPVFVFSDKNLTLELFIYELNFFGEFLKNSVGGFRKKPNKFLEFDWGKNYSSGEKAYLDLFSRLWYAKSEIKEKAYEEDLSDWKNKLPSHLILILDEGELGFHPQWQKEYLNGLLKLVPKIFRIVDEEVNWLPSIQLLLTTHSPFLLSDIPMSHAMFFDKNQNGSVLVKNAFDDGIHETFGANIHEIFTSNFFLSNGLIGEFAKNKIDSIYNEINQGKKTDFQKMRNQIELIGEDLIRERLEFLINEKDSKESLKRYYQSKLKELED